MFDSRFLKNGHVLCILRSVASRFARSSSEPDLSRYAVTALPKPNQPVSNKRH
ncbi:hypothetical protein AWB80_08498 [Caballeronia pedi]|uniref:Uncharacterized protein n=1 Tax=Caballeronia pedi TaxID=1777141 RepID=A0A158E8M0_9BURK|nr:hypothetical protein AWB80_08498 [Caballeronia pedi]